MCRGAISAHFCSCAFLRTFNIHDAEVTEHEEVKNLVLNEAYRGFYPRTPTIATPHLLDIGY